MKNISIGRKLYLGVLAVFLVFAVAFIVFQQIREKQFKIEKLDMSLHAYNVRMDEWMMYTAPEDKADIDEYVRHHSQTGQRVTLIDESGRVLYDSSIDSVGGIENHANRPEVRQALREGHGSTVERSSATVGRAFFYSATYFPSTNRIVRSALPYDSSLVASLRADQHYIWFALVAIVMLTLFLYRFMGRLGDNIAKLRTFARRAAHNESLDTEDLAVFPDDELGEIAERIIKIYKRLQTTRQEQDMLKKQLTQNIAHELKTPVASIKGYLETIIENPQVSDDKKMQFLRNCYAQSERLASLLRDISMLNRLDDAPQMTTFDNVNVTQTVADIIRETTLQLQSRKMTFTNRLPANLRIKGNQSLVYSIFRNLTDNAIAYAGEGTEITLLANEMENYWHFTFSDNGVGVPSEHLPRLFERFYRVDKGRSRKMGGTGLGLAIVKNAVLLHGGTISVRNNPKQGLRFDFTLRK